MTVLIINNYCKPEHADRINYYIEAVRENSENDAKVVSFRDLSPHFRTSKNICSIILSGSSAHLPQDVEMYKNEVELIKRCELPVLGICFGHQLIGYTFGCRVRSYDSYIIGFQKVKILEVDEIFRGWKKGQDITVKESHMDYIAELTNDFDWLATSDSCQIEAIKHKSKPMYGVQFHSERRLDEATGKKYEDGRKVIRNFFETVVKK